MIFKCINGIVSGTKCLNTGRHNDVLSGHFGGGKLFVAKLPYGIAGIFVQYTVISEITLKLEMRPMVKRITYKLRHTASVSLELFISGAVTGDIFFLNTAGADSSPLIMVTAKP